MTGKLIIVILSILLLVETASVTRGDDETQYAGAGTITMEMVLYNLAEKLTELLSTVRDVIAINQVRINTCSVANHYDFKGLTPAAIGTQVCNYFSLSTGIRMKQTSLRLRNPQNAPDDWERRALEMFEDPDYPNGFPHAEISTVLGEEVYRFIKPVYISEACLRCHGEKETIREDILEYLETHYPNDISTGYRVGELRGGISITIPVAEQGLTRPSLP